MKKYGGYSNKDRKKYLCKGNLIIKERFTDNEKDYLKKDIIYTIIEIFPNLKYIHKKNIQKYSKNVIFSLLQSIYTNYLNNIDKIIYIQRYIKENNIKKLNKLRGPGYLNNKLCKNHEDFLYMIQIETSDKNYFYSYIDPNKHIWYFDIRSIYKLLKSNKDNPYTRDPFPKLVYEQVIKLIKYLKKQNIDVNIEEYKPKDMKEVVKRKLIDLSVNISQSGYSFNKEWIENLNIHKLIHLYKLLEDMWNFRAQMTIEQKKIIIPPTGIIFNYPIRNLYKLSWEKIANIIIDDINKFENSIEEGNQKLGYIYLIACLSDIHIECYQNNNWVHWL